LAIRYSICILCISLFMSILCLARGQDFPVGSSETISTFAGFQFYSRTLKGKEEEKVQQWVLPVSLAGRIGENLKFRVYQTMSHAQIEDGPSLSGLGNTKIRGSYVLLENALVTYLGLSIPVASVEPTTETVPLSNLLYTDVLNFGVNRLTEGFDLDLGFAFAQPFGKLSFGLGMGYLIRGSYDRLSQGGTYNPGNPISLSAGINSFSRLVNLGFKVIYVHYGDDKIEAGDSFENSDSLSFRISIKPRFKPIAIRLLLADTMKFGDDDLDEETTINNFFKNRLSGGLFLAYPLLGDTITLKAQAVVKMLLDDSGTNAKSASFGGGFRILLTDNLKLDFSTNIINGDMEAGETNISGFDLSAMVGYGF